MRAEEFAESSREALIALIVEQQATIGTLQRRISLLEKRRSERGGPGMPGTKPPAPKDERPLKVRKKRGHG